MNKINMNTQIVTFLLLGLILAGPATAQVPQMMSYQGLVTAALIGADGQMKSLSFPHGFNAYVIEAFKELEAENAALRSRLERVEALLEAQVQ